VAARAGRAISWYLMLTVCCGFGSVVERELDRKRQWVRLIDEEEEDKEMSDDDISGIDGEK
jgi:hypothetical protein